MILEVAILDVIPGQESDFQASFAEAKAIISSMPGYISHELKRCVEKPSRYILLVSWETLEDHTEGFRASPQYQEWKALLHHYYDPFPDVEHYYDDVEASGHDTAGSRTSSTATVRNSPTRRLLG